MFSNQLKPKYSFEEYFKCCFPLITLLQSDSLWPHQLPYFHSVLITHIHFDWDFTLYLNKLKELLIAIGPVVLRRKKKMKMWRVNHNNDRQQIHFNQKSSLDHLAQVSL